MKNESSRKEEKNRLRLKGSMCQVFHKEQRHNKEREHRIVSQPIDESG